MIRMMNLPSKDGCPQLIVAAVRMNAQFDRWAPLRWAWRTGASAHGGLLNSPSAFEQFHFVEKIPARISRGCYGLESRLLSLAERWLDLADAEESKARRGRSLRHQPLCLGTQRTAMQYAASRKWRASCTGMRTRCARSPRRSASKQGLGMGKGCERCPT